MLSIPAADDKIWRNPVWRTKRLRQVRDDYGMKSQRMATLCGVASITVLQWLSKDESQIVPDYRLRLLLLELKRATS